MAKQLVNAKELHQIFPRLSLWTINQKRREGRIPFIKIPNTRVFLFDVDRVERWLDGLELQSMNPSEGRAKAK